MKFQTLLFTLYAATVSSQSVVSVYTTVRATSTISTQGQANARTTSTAYIVVSRSTVAAGGTSTAVTTTATPPTGFSTVATPRDASSPVPASTNAPKPSDYASTGTYYHNKHRANHSAPALSWNPTQANNAAQIASSCRFAHNMTVGGGGYGQNLAAAGGTGNVQAIDTSLTLAKAITNGWYNSEVNSFLPSYYGQATPPMDNFGAWGHFSQVVWKGSTSVGCASQYCPPGTIFSAYASWFTVCNYVPQGNILGQFDKNVLKSLGQPSISV